MNRWGAPPHPTTHLPSQRHTWLPLKLRLNIDANGLHQAVRGKERAEDRKGKSVNCQRVCSSGGLFWSVKPTGPIFSPEQSERVLCVAGADCSSSVIPPRECLKGWAGLVGGRAGGGGSSGLQVEGLERSSCWSELQDASQKCDNMLLICIVLVHAHTSSAHSGQTVGGREAAATWWDDSEWFFGDFFFFLLFFSFL